MNAHLAEKAHPRCRSGTLVDATIIDATVHPQEQGGARDPEESSTKKGKQLVLRG